MESRYKQNKLWVNYISTAVSLMVVALVICLSKDLFAKTELVDIVKILCDAVTVPGIVSLCFGLLSICNKEGTFDGLGYTFKSFWRVSKNYRDDEKAPKSYSEYKDSVKGKRKISWHFIIVGAAFTVIGIVLNVIYSNLV